MEFSIKILLFLILRFSDLKIFNFLVSDDTLSSSEEIQFSAKEKREARSIVREALREKRAKLKELRQGMREGHDLADDMDTCLGEVDLLLKELQSIEEGGHATFRQAKELLAPKRDVSSKKTNLRDEASNLRKEINHLEERLYMPNLSVDERSKMNLSISNKRERLKDLEEELNALQQYNHTRFVNARDESRKTIEQETKLEVIEKSIQELGNQMLEALEKVDEPEISRIQERITSLEGEKQELLNPEGDPLLHGETDE